jgi:tetratricopeptide (TPR) repeat protein
MGAGCRHAPPPATQTAPPSPPSPTFEHPDQELLEEALKGRGLSPVEVANLSDRLLAEGSPTFQNERLMAQLDILLTKTLKGEQKEHRHRLLRNLGIIHYHQKKFSLARQELQQANEIYPRDARTHFYLARLAVHQGKIYQRKGLSKKAKGQFNLASNELELARKFEPSNPLYRQNLKEFLDKEQPLPGDRKK